MTTVDIIIINQSNLVDYDEFSHLPPERMDLYRQLIYPRMVYYQGRYRSHLELLALCRAGQTEALNIWDLPGYSGMHLANILSGQGIHAVVINNLDSQWDLFCQTYLARDPRPMVGLSCTFHLSYRPVSKMIKRLRQLDPEMNIVLGGAFISDQATHQGVSSFSLPMTRYNINYILYGFNSESDLCDLIRYHRDPVKIARVKNLVYRDQGQVHMNPPQWYDPWLHHIPSKWDQLALTGINHTVQFRTSSGCPFACAFCSYPQTAGGYFTMEVPEVESHLRALLRRPGVNQIIFIDDTLNVPPPRFRALCDVFGRHSFRWYSFLRVQYIDEPAAKMMRESGCQAVYLGMESANDEVLKRMNKRASRAEYARGIHALRKYDIKTIGAFIIGFPGETDETIQDNIDFIENEGLDFYTLKEFYYLPGTPVHQHREKYGLTGEGNTWSHTTMDSARAYQIKLDMLRQINRCVYIDADTNLWYLAYLADQGYSLDHIAALQREVNAIMVDQINHKIDDHHPAYERLKTLLSKGV